MMNIIYCGYNGKGFNKRSHEHSIVEFNVLLMLTLVESTGHVLTKMRDQRSHEMVRALSHWNADMGPLSGP